MLTLERFSNRHERYIDIPPHHHGTRRHIELRSTWHNCAKARKVAGAHWNQFRWFKRSDALATVIAWNAWMAFLFNFYFFDFIYLSGYFQSVKAIWYKIFSSWSLSMCEYVHAPFAYRGESVDIGAVRSWMKSYCLLVDFYGPTIAIPHREVRGKRFYRARLGIRFTWVCGLLPRIKWNIMLFSSVL